MDRLDKKIEGSVTLSDGRALSYTTYGDPLGTPVVVLDGPCSRGLARAAAETAAAEGIRLIAPDRPGAFGSTPQTGRRIVDWPADHAALLDALEIERAGVFGQSGGTPYSLAAAAALPDRVTAVSLMGAMAPLHDKGAMKEAGSQVRAGARLARKAPWLLKFALRRQDPEKMARKAVTELPPIDAKLMQQDRWWQLHLTSTEEILGQAPAVVEELALIAKPWGVDFSAVRCPVEFWTGEGDPVHPAPHARRLAKALGGRPVHVIPDAATFGLLPHYAEALRHARGA